MKIRIIMPMILLVVTVVVAGAQIEPPSTPGQDDMDMYKYVVKRGDTLWDLGSRFMDDPYKWPRIWQANPHIDDPHWIYPGDVLLILPPEDEQMKKIEGLPVERMGTEYAEAGEAGEEETVVWTSPTVMENSVTFTPAQVMGFMTTDDLKITAVIHSAYIKNFTYGAFDKVYVSAGRNKGFKVGDKFSIIRSSKRIRHPVTNKKLGHIVKTLGVLQLIKIEEKSSEAEIIESNAEIFIGDHLVPTISTKKTVRYTDIDARYHNNPLETVILTSMEGKEYFGREDIVYIDGGKNQGIKPGNLFNIYKPKIKERNPQTGKKELEPEKIIGRLVIMSVSDDYSVAFITQSLQEFRAGEKIRSIRFRGAE